jgi:hypothetical protein
MWSSRQARPTCRSRSWHNGARWGQDVLDFLADGTVSNPTRLLVARGQVLLIQSESRVEVAKFEELLTAAMDGARQVAEILETEIKEHTQRLVAAKNLLR